MPKLYWTCDLCHMDILLRNAQRHVMSIKHVQKFQRRFHCSYTEAVEASREYMRLIEGGVDQMMEFVDRGEIDRLYDLFSVDDEQPAWTRFAPIPVQPPHAPPRAPPRGQISHIPSHFQAELAELGWECSVCLEPMDSSRFALTSCYHKVCKTCMSQLSDRRCPVCRHEQ